MSRSNKRSNSCVIGLTGSLGSGKSTVARMFADLGAEVIDADQIAHQLMRPKNPCFREVVQLFGDEILASGRIDRKKIADKVFRNSRLLRKLERIIHPEVRKAILAKIKQRKKVKRGGVIIIDVPLLFEAKLNRLVDLSIVVKASKAKQVERAAKSLNITKAEAARRIGMQMPLQRKIRLADIIIDNNGTRKQTKMKVKLIWEKL